MTSEIKQILQEIDIRPDATENESGSKAVFVLLQLVERLNQENEILKIENQKLRDEVNLLKGEQGKPNVRGNKKGGQCNVSSEAERKQRKKERKPNTKKDKIKIDRTDICKVDQSELPNDAEFRGYENIVVQEIMITTDNVEYKRKKYYSPSENKTYLGKVPIGVKGEFGPGIRALACTLKHVGNMSEPKILEFLVVEKGQIVKGSKDKNGVVNREVLTRNWIEWIDYWAVDVDFESKREITRVQNEDSGEWEERWIGDFIFENEWQAFRSKKDRFLELKRIFHECMPGRRKLAVKVVDIFGNDTMTIVEVTI